MEKLKLHIKSENPIMLEIPNPSDDLKKHVVDSLLAKVHIFNTIEMSGDPFLPLGEPIPFSEITPVEITPEKTYKPLPVKTTPVIEEKSFEELLAEDDARRDAKKEKEAEHDHYATGYKIKNGKKCYKCRYKCTNSTCNLESNHYIWEGTEEVECHGCGNSLKVKKATPEMELEKDPFGNFYVAGKRRPFYEINTY